MQPRRCDRLHFPAWRPIRGRVRQFGFSAESTPGIVRGYRSFMSLLRCSTAASDVVLVTEPSPVRDFRGWINADAAPKAFVHPLPDFVNLLLNPVFSGVSVRCKRRARPRGPHQGVCWSVAVVRLFFVESEGHFRAGRDTVPGGQFVLRANLVVLENRVTRLVNRKQVRVHGVALGVAHTFRAIKTNLHGDALSRRLPVGSGPICGARIDM
jgi:hypothetical protein